MSRYRILAASLVTLGCLGALGLQVNQEPGLQMTKFANAFLENLEESKRDQARVPYESEQRTNWHFIPKDSRKGVALREMNSSQKAAALRLVRAALSESGYTKTNKIMMLEQLLRTMEGEERRWERDPNKYYVTIFGEPSDTDAWGLSFEGHHLSLNFVVRDGKVVDSTPQFFGANPATVMTDVRSPLEKGTQVLRQEEALAFEMVNTLDEQQKGKAMIAEEAFSEIRFAGEPQPEVSKPEGLKQSEMNTDQQEMLKELIMVYLRAVPPAVAERRLERINENGWDEIHFAWAGATEPGIGHYYRIQGKAFLIEFVNTQPDPDGNPANHIHCVYRDLTGDFDLDIE